MKYLLFPFLVFVAIIDNFGQKMNNNCNQYAITKAVLSQLDSNMCIPNGYHVVNVINNIDINADSLSDKIVKYHKVIKKDGDTVFYQVYLQKNDKKRYLKKTYTNLRPLFFDCYDPSCHLEDSVLNEIKNRYRSPGLSEAHFYTGGISILFYLHATGYKVLFFNYNKKKDDWILAKEEEWEDYERFGTPKKKLSTKTYTTSTGYSLSKFSFFDYLEE